MIFKLFIYSIKLVSCLFAIEAISVHVTRYYFNLHQWQRFLCYLYQLYNFRYDLYNGTLYPYMIWSLLSIFLQNQRAKSYFIVNQFKHTCMLICITNILSTHVMYKTVFAILTLSRLLRFAKYFTKHVVVLVL